MTTAAISNEKRTEPLALAGITVQLAAVLLLVQALQIEPTSGLPRILPLIFGGFIVHALLPLKWRQPFFLSLSFAAVMLVLGPVPGALLITLGLGIVGVCHLPIAFSMRLGLLLTIAG